MLTYLVLDETAFAKFDEEDAAQKFYDALPESVPVTIGDKTIHVPKNHISILTEDDVHYDGDSTWCG